MADEHDAVARGNAQHRNEPNQRTQGKHSLAQERPRHTANQGERQGQRHEEYDSTGTKIDMKQDEDPKHKKRREQQQSIARRLTRSIFPKEFRVPLVTLVTL